MKNIIVKNSVECFFLTNLISAVFLKDLFFLHLFISIIILNFHIRERVKYSFIIIIIILKLILSHSFLIIDIDSAHKEGITYTTTMGKVTLEDYYTPGTLFFRGFLSNDHPTIAHYRLPVVSSILSFRKIFSESLYIHSNGVLKLTQALVVGDRSNNPIEINDKFIITGLIHLLAISGSHIAIITTLLFFLLFFIPKKIRYIAVSLFLLLYMPFAAFNVPVIRACLCAIIIMMLFFFGIKVDYRKFLLFMASLFIIISPTVISDLSFIMSFLAVAGIVYLGFRSKNSLLNAAYVGLAAQTALMPLTLYTFGMTNICSLLSTLIILPFISINILLGVLSIINPAIFSPILIYIEKVVLYIVNQLYKYTYEGFFLFKINIFLFIFMLLIIITVFYMPKYRWFIFSIYVFLFIPVKSEYGYYVYRDYYNLSIVLILDNHRELYVKGDYYFYKHKLLPQLAKIRTKTFDNGIISVRGASNHYIRFPKSSGLKKICINKRKNSCTAFYENNRLYVAVGNSINAHKIEYGKFIFIPLYN